MSVVFPVPLGTWRRAGGVCGDMAGRRHRFADSGGRQSPLPGHPAAPGSWFQGRGVRAASQGPLPVVFSKFYFVKVMFLEHRGFQDRGEGTESSRTAPPRPVSPALNVPTA